MKRGILLFVTLLLVSATLSLAAETPDFIEFQKVIDDKCSKCHARTRVDQAMADHRDMLEIQQRMIRHGLELNSREQQVLGIFFRGIEVKKTPGKQAQVDPLAEYRSVVEARCSGCHSLEIVEQAMRENRNFGSLAQMMIERGAVLHDRDMKIIQTFWGEPLK